MSGPLVPYIDIQPYPIPPWAIMAALSVAAVVAVYTAYKGRNEGGSILVGLGGVALPLLFWFVIKPRYYDPADPWSIKPFGVLVALGVYIGSIVAVRHARQRALDLDKMNSFIFWVVGLGFVGGHVFDAIFYTPERITHDPTYIIKIWAGLSSFGGFVGAIIGAVLYRATKREKILPFVDTVCSAFPLAWVFGRSGCASVHDHPGLLSNVFFAVKGWPGLPEGQGRFDLGFMEMVLTIPLAIAFWWLWRKRPRHIGFFTGWMCVAYAPVRFGLDFLRIAPSATNHDADPRYGGLTPAQWACFGLIGLGFLIIRIGKRDYPNVPATYEEIQEQARAKLLEEEDAAGPVAPVVKKKKKKKKKTDAPVAAAATNEAAEPSEGDAKPAEDEGGDAKSAAKSDAKKSEDAKPSDDASDDAAEEPAP